MKTMKRWIRRRLRALLGVDAELRDLRRELEAVKRELPHPEIRRKVHHA